VLIFTEQGSASDGNNVDFKERRQYRKTAPTPRRISGWQRGKVGKNDEYFELTYCSSKYAKSDGWPTVLHIGAPVEGMAKLIPFPDQ